MAKTLTMANAVITLVVPAIELGPFQLQRFAADDVFNTGELDVAETSMGVDGNLSAGFVFRGVEVTLPSAELAAQVLARLPGAAAPPAARR